MSFAEAACVAAEILKVLGITAGLGLLGLTTAAWCWYRADGGKLGLIAWIRGL